MLTIGLVRELDEALRADADRRPGRTGAHAGGAPVEVLAHVALDRLLGRRRRDSAQDPPARSRAPAEQQPLREAGLRRRLGGHLDHAVRTVALAVAAADAVVADVDFAVGAAADRIRRAVGHAVR